MEKEQGFFMVYLEGERTPTFKHGSLESAEKEAKRLSEFHQKKAYVLCTIKSFEVKDCRPIENLPF